VGRRFFVYTSEHSSPKAIFQVGVSYASEGFYGQKRIWKSGMMAYWNIGLLNGYHHSSIPIFHYSGIFYKQVANYNIRLTCHAGDILDAYDIETFW
jgi:hypothetical protein